MKRITVFVVACLVATACGETAEPDQSSTTTPGTTQGGVATTVPAPTTTTTTATPDDDIVRVEVVLVGGDVLITVDGESRERRIDVTLGQTVVIEFTSDVAEELHVHGYDVLVVASPGQPGIEEFTANIPGIFGVEQHFAGHVAAFSIQVS